MPRPVIGPAQKAQTGEPINVKQYIGFDIHKTSISYCVKSADGTILDEGKLAATRAVLRGWASKRVEPWHGAMEATLFPAGGFTTR
jgi:hypothetical protein